MENSQVKSNLIIIEEKEKIIYGNMKFFNKGNVAFNTKAVGIYFTLLFLLTISSLVIYLR